MLGLHTGVFVRKAFAEALHSLYRRPALLPRNGSWKSKAACSEGHICGVKRLLRYLGLRVPSVGATPDEIPAVLHRVFIMLPLIAANVACFVRVLLSAMTFSRVVDFVVHDHRDLPTFSMFWWSGAIR